MRNIINPRRYHLVTRSEPNLSAPFLSDSTLRGLITQWHLSAHLCSLIQDLTIYVEFDGTFDDFVLPPSVPPEEYVFFRDRTRVLLCAECVSVQWDLELPTHYLIVDAKRNLCLRGDTLSALVTQHRNATGRWLSASSKVWACLPRDLLGCEDVVLVPGYLYLDDQEADCVAPHYYFAFLDRNEIRMKTLFKTSELI